MRRALKWLGIAGGAALVFAGAAYVFEHETQTLRLIATSSAPDGMRAAYSDARRRVHVYEDQRLIGVIRGHDSEIIGARFLHPGEILTYDRETSRRTDLEKLDRLPIIERVHLEGIRDNVWLPYGRPVLLAMQAGWAAIVDFVTPAPKEAPANLLEMVQIPGGTFLMGSPEDEPGRFGDESPQRDVTIQAFEMARTETTFDQWQACVDGGGCTTTPNPDHRGWGKGARPVINVSWEDAPAIGRERDA